MTGLLVSVRSVAEALAAESGGAAVVDLKEPARGPLGMADPRLWGEVRRALRPETPVSVALGELRDWLDGPPAPPFAGIAYRKLGLAGSGPDWRRDWDRLRRAWGAGPAWIAVAYSDWSRAGAPPPDEVVDAALAAADCAGLLVDTWDKSRPPPPLDESWRPRLERARQAGRRIALAGGLDRAGIGRLSTFAPDLFAVRGAACTGGDRDAAIDGARVEELVRAVRSTGSQGVTRS